MATSAQERLRARGLRATRPRTTVLTVLDEAGDLREHLPVGEVADRARARLGSLSLQAVYDCLEALTRVELARRIEPAGHPARYEGRVGDNHHHVVCRDCGTTSDVDCVVGAAPCLAYDPGHDPSHDPAHNAARDAAAEPADFVVDEAEVIFWGRCPACASQPAAVRRTTERPTNGLSTDREESR